MARRFSVYVVQVRSRCRRCKARRKPTGRCCVYVGSTSKTPEARLLQHLDPPSHIKPTVVTECGGSLRPDLAPGLVFQTRPQAERAEVALAAELKRLGYTVWGPRHKHPTADPQ